MLESNFSKNANLNCWNFIKKKLQHRCFLVEFANFLRTPFFYRTPPLAASAFIRLTHALWIKLIWRNSGTGIFLWIFQNFGKHYWPPLVAAFCHKMQNIKIRHDSYMQRAHGLMVNIVSEVTGFYLLQRRI